MLGYMVELPEESLDHFHFTDHVGIRTFFISLPPSLRCASIKDHAKLTWSMIWNLIRRPLLTKGYALIGPKREEIGL